MLYALVVIFFRWLLWGRNKTGLDGSEHEKYHIFGTSVLIFIFTFISYSNSATYIWYDGSARVVPIFSSNGLQIFFVLYFSITIWLLAFMAIGKLFAWIKSKTVRKRQDQQKDLVQEHRMEIPKKEVERQEHLKPHLSGADEVKKQDEGGYVDFIKRQKIDPQDQEAINEKPTN